MMKEEFLEVFVCFKRKEVHTRKNIFESREVEQLVLTKYALTELVNA
jgi:hypothetical protein